MVDAGSTRFDDDALLWRRVPPDRLIYQEPIEAQGDAFRTKGTEDGVSVGIAEFFISKGQGPEALLELEPLADETWGVLEITVGELRAEEGLDVEVDGDDESHALIKPPPGRKPARRLSKSAPWAHYPRFP